jgi:nucleoside-diphosphate-sugar epimerase
MTRVFVAGGNGALGRPLLPLLVADGHTVVASTRKAEAAAAIDAAGAQPTLVDVFDAAALAAELVSCRPEVVVHLVTDLAIPGGGSLTDEQLARTAHVREVGTRNVVEGAVAAGAGRIVAASICWLYTTGTEPHDEDDSIEPVGGAPTPVRRGVISLERQVLRDERFDGLVLRFGRLYGPGTWAPTADTPPTVHVDDAARALLAAIVRGAPGAYNIAESGGPVSIDKAGRELGWEPSHGRQAPR